jgi:hypothetical protein
VHGDLLQERISQEVEKPSAFIGDFGCFRGIRLSGDQVSQHGRFVVVLMFQPAKVSLTPSLVSSQVGRLPNGQHHQEFPEVIPVFQAGEPALLGPPAKTVEGTQGDVFFIRSGARQPGQFPAGESDEAMEVPLPEFLNGLPFSGLELVDPHDYRSHVRHYQDAGHSARNQGGRPGFRYRGQRGRWDPELSSNRPRALARRL